MVNELLNEQEKNILDLNNSVENEQLEKEQNSFLKTNLGQAINKGIDVGIKILLPNFIEDEVIAIKDSLLTEGFSAAIDTAIEEATNLGKTAIGIVTGTFENISQIKKAVKSGGLIDTVSDILDSGISWAQKHGYIKKNVAKAIKNGKNTIVENVKDGIDNSLEEQVNSIDKIYGYVNKWYTYYEEKNFTNMEYQYNKIQENLEKIIPLEDVIKKARIVENLHELIKNNGKNFELNENEKELAEILSN